MISLMVAQSHLSVTAIVFYTCFWIPFNQLKETLLSIIGLMLVRWRSCEQEQVESFHIACYDDIDNDDELAGGLGHLPVSRFYDLCKTTDGNGSVVVDQPCSICLGGFQREDEVTQLSTCAHVFHLRCIKTWVDRNHFTCPLCRSLFLS